MGRRTAAAGDSAPAGDARPIFFMRHQKENAPRPVEKKTCSAGRPAQAQPSCRRRGKVGSPLRQSETETRRPWGNLQPGEVQGYPLPLSPLPLTLPRRSRQRLAKRKAQKEKLVECILAPRRCRHHPPRDSSHDLAEDDSVPEGKPKSALAPIRRPPLRAEGHCTGARPSGLFFWTVHGPFSFPQVGKENGGCIPAGQAPYGGRIPVAAGRRPKFPRAVCNLPYTLQGRPYHRAAEGGGPYGCTERIYPRASLRPSR